MCFSIRDRSILKKYIYFLLLIISSNASAQVINTGPRYVALASAGVALQDIWALQHNQAGLAVINTPTAAVGYQQRYLNQDVSTQTALFALPYQKNVFGVSFQRYGFSAYNEQRMGLAYARNFGSTVLAALSFNFHQVKIPGYGSAQTFSAEAGLQYRVTENMWLGAHLANPTGNGYRVSVDAVVPVRVAFGASWYVSDKVLIASAIEKTLNENTDLRNGIEYELADWLALRGGLAVNPFSQYLGFGFAHQGFRVDAAASSHPVLGFSPQIGLNYAF